MIEHFNATLHKYKHGPVRMLAEKHRKKVKIGCVRNAFDWYVSYFTYHKDNGRWKDLSFDKYIRDYVTNPRALLSLMPPKLRKKYKNLYPPDTKMPIGGYTFHYINYFCYDAINVLKHWDYNYFKLNISKISNLDAVLRTETLRDNMEIIFGAEHHDKLLDFKKRNVSKRKPYQEYFSPDLRALVEERDGPLMNYLGYKYE